MIYLQDPDVTIHHGDVHAILPELDSGTVDCVITSPPYWGLRDYATAGQLGLEPTPEQYLARMVALFREVRRVLAPHGTLWLNMGDSYNTKDLVGIPWKLAFALQQDGWYLRADIIWSKPNPMPESVTDRPTKAHEYVFLLTRQPRYYFDAEAVREPHTSNALERSLNPVDSYGTGIGNGQNSIKVGCVGANPAGRNIRSVWEIPTQPYPDAHFATYPEELVRRCLLAGCPPGGTVLDPFLGSGTTAHVARKHQRHTIGIELNHTYCRLAARRLQQLSLLAL